MKKILKIINYIVKVFFAIIGIFFLIGLFSDDLPQWSLSYEEDLEQEINTLLSKIDTETDAIEQVKYTLRLVELKKRKIYFDKTIERFNNADWSSILEDNGIDGGIEYLNVDANFEDFVKTEPLPDVRSGRWLHKALLDDLTKEQRYYVIHELYEFKSVMEENKSYRDKARAYLEKSLEVKRGDWTLYQYALFLAEDGNAKSIELFKEAISISDEQEFILQIKNDLAKSLRKFERRDEAVKVYMELLANKKYKDEALIVLATLFNDHRAIEYFSKIENRKFEDLDKKYQFMKAKENVAVIYLYKKDYEKAKQMLEELLEFYFDISKSNPKTFIEIAKVNKNLYAVYKALEMKGSEEESLKRAIFYYKALNRVYADKYMDELRLVKRLMKELGE